MVSLPSNLLFRLWPMLYRLSCYVRDSPSLAFAFPAISVYSLRHCPYAFYLHTLNLVVMRNVLYMCNWIGVWSFSLVPWPDVAWLNSSVRWQCYIAHFALALPCPKIQVTEIRSGPSETGCPHADWTEVVSVLCPVPRVSSPSSGCPYQRATTQLQKKWILTHCYSGDVPVLHVDRGKARIGSQCTSDLYNELRTRFGVNSNFDRPKFEKTIDIVQAKHYFILITSDRHLHRHCHKDHQSHPSEAR
jgi:hypothetical protein